MGPADPPLGQGGTLVGLKRPLHRAGPMAILTQHLGNHLLEWLPEERRGHIDTRNEDAEPFARTAVADSILRRVENVCMDTSDSRHQK